VDPSDPGTVIVQKNDLGSGGSLDISMPSLDGYDAVFAERTSDNALKLTFVGKDEYGNTKTFVVIVENFFELSAHINDPTSIPRLTFHGGSGNDIIDFRVQLDNQVINIVDDQGGNDIILGPTSEVVASGLKLDKPEDLLDSQGNNSGSLTSILQETDAEYYEDQGVTATVQSEPAQIVIEDADGDPTNNESLGIDVPEGYDKGYITSDADGNLYVILVKKSGDGKTKSIVYKIDASLTVDKGGNLTWKSISAGSLDLVPISNLEPDPITGVSDYTLDAGTDGDDFVLYEEGWKTEDKKEEKKKYKG